MVLISDFLRLSIPWMFIKQPISHPTTVSAPEAIMLLTFNYHLMKSHHLLTIIVVLLFAGYESTRAQEPIKIAILPVQVYPGSTISTEFQYSFPITLQEVLNRTNEARFQAAVMDTALLKKVDGSTLAKFRAERPIPEDVLNKLIGLAKQNFSFKDQYLL